MTDTIFQIFKIAIKMTSFVAMILALIVIFNLTIATVSSVYNGSILDEIVSMIQMWLPFDLSKMINFLTTTAMLILTYYLSRITIKKLNELL